MVYNGLMSIGLLFSSQFLKDKRRSSQIGQVLASATKSIRFLEQQYSDPLVQMAYNKLQLTTQSYKKDTQIFTIKLWCQDDIITELMIKNTAINVVYSQQRRQIQGNVINSNRLIIITDLKQLRLLFSTSIFQIERRCKMQKLARISSARCRQNQSKAKIKEMGLKYGSLKQGRQIQGLLSFMRYNTKWYKQRVRKCFNLWVIETYQKGIDRMNQNIIKEQYCCKMTQRRLLRRCFEHWKNYCNNYI